MRYTVILKNGDCFVSNWLLFPDWGQTLAIADIKNSVYINEKHWKNEEMDPDWQEIAEDHL